MDKIKKLAEIMTKIEEIFKESGLNNLEVIGILEQLKYTLIK